MYSFLPILVGQFDHRQQHEPPSPIALIIGLAVLALFLASWWKMFVKAGKPGWAALIPIYNMAVMLEIAGRPIWWILLLIIPCIGYVFLFVVAIDIAKSFGKDTAFGIGLALLGFIFYPILGFGDAQYIGPAARR